MLKIKREVRKRSYIRCGQLLRSFLGGRVEKWIVGGEAEIEYMAEEDFFLRCKIRSIFIQQWE